MNTRYSVRKRFNPIVNGRFCSCYYVPPLSRRLIPIQETPWKRGGTGLPCKKIFYGVVTSATCVIVLESIFPCCNVTSCSIAAINHYTKCRLWIGYEYIPFILSWISIGGVLEVKQILVINTFTSPRRGLRKLWLNWRIRKKIVQFCPIKGKQYGQNAMHWQFTKTHFSQGVISDKLPNVTQLVWIRKLLI